jgi:chromosome segregation ATPase
MTSLHETLPILDLAVPALPGKVEAVSREAESFEKAAREAVAGFQEKRRRAEALTEQIRHALQALRDRAEEELRHVEEAGRAMAQSAEDEAGGIEEGASELEARSEQVDSAFSALESHLGQGAERTRAAHEEGRAALDKLGEGLATGCTTLEGAVDAVTAAVGHAQEAVTDARSQVAEGVAVLGDSLSRLLADARSRLDHTVAALDELRSEQEGVVRDVRADLEDGGGQMEQQIGARLQEGLANALSPELDALVGILDTTGQQVAQLEADGRTRRDQLDPQLAAVGERIEPLQTGVEQVKQAAARLGISWP